MLDRPPVRLEHSLHRFNELEGGSGVSERMRERESVGESVSVREKEQSQRECVRERARECVWGRERVCVRETLFVCESVRESERV